MTDRPRRARRVQLSTPGSSEKMMQKASESKADHVFLDLEDAVAPSQKREARKKIVAGAEDAQLEPARRAACASTTSPPSTPSRTSSRWSRAPASISTPS